MVLVRVMVMILFRFFLDSFQISSTIYFSDEESDSSDDGTPDGDADEDSDEEPFGFEDLVRGSLATELGKITQESVDFEIAKMLQMEEFKKIDQMLETPPSLSSPSPPPSAGDKYP